MGEDHERKIGLVWSPGWVPGKMFWVFPGRAPGKKNADSVLLDLSLFSIWTLFSLISSTSSTTAMPMSCGRFTTEAASVFMDVWDRKVVRFYDLRVIRTNFLLFSIKSWMWHKKSDPKNTQSDSRFHIGIRSDPIKPNPIRTLEMGTNFCYFFCYPFLATNLLLLLRPRKMSNKKE